MSVTTPTCGGLAAPAIPAPASASASAIPLSKIRNYFSTGFQSRKCKGCGLSKGRDDYSNRQWFQMRGKDVLPTCKNCVVNEHAKREAVQAQKPPRIVSKTKIDKWRKRVAQSVRRKEAEMIHKGRCPKCWHHKASRCICSYLPPLKFASEVSFYVYVHFTEWYNAGDDAKLLALAAPEQTQIFVYGKEGDDARFVHAIQQGGGYTNTLMLFPDRTAVTLQQFLRTRGNGGDGGGGGSDAERCEDTTAAASAIPNVKSIGASNKNVEPNIKSAGTSDKITKPSIKSAAASDKITEPCIKTAGASDKSAEVGNKSAGASNKSAEPSIKNAGASDKSAEPSIKNAGASDKSAGAKECVVPKTKPLQVIVLDATWKRALTMMHHLTDRVFNQSPTTSKSLSCAKNATAVAHVKLETDSVSVYARTQSMPGRICSIEAVALLLKEYGEDPRVCNQLIRYVEINNLVVMMASKQTIEAAVAELHS